MIHNFTPHAIHIANDQKKPTETTIIPRGNEVIRCCASTKPKELTRLTYDGKMYFPVVEPTKYDGLEIVDQDGKKIDKSVVKMLQNQPNDYYVVSGIVAEFITKQMPQFDANLLVPDTDPSVVVRDQKGGVAGTIRLYTYGQWDK